MVLEDTAVKMPTKGLEEVWTDQFKDSALKRTEAIMQDSTE